MHKVPVWVRQDLTEEFWDKDPKGFPWYGFQNGINKEILSDKSLHSFDAHGDPYIAMGTTTLTASLIYEFLTSASELKGKKYYYPIPYVPHHNDIDLDDLILIEPLHLKHVRKGNCKILIINHMEGWNHNGFFKIFIDAIITKYKLSYKNFVILSGNMQKTEYGVPTIYYNWWEHHHAPVNNPGIYDYGREGLYHQTRLQRKNKFLCLNRRAHWHRIVLAALMLEHKEKGILTSHKITDNSDGLWNKNIDVLKEYLACSEADGIEEFNNIELKIKELEKQLPIQYYDDGFDCNNDNPTMDQHLTKFYDSYLHIVSETYLENGQTFFSEKIFKPIMHFQPFILIGSHNDLQALRSLGYKTFEGIIDETYDTIESPFVRLATAYNEIVRIINLSNDELEKMYIDCQDILIHNYWHWVYRQNIIPWKLKNDLLRELNE
ncbi:hypothetical protein OAA64_01430 [bacterium]|nr:hypothetical protein [bacterium]